MANLQIKDATPATVYVKATGAGTGGDPHVPHHNVDKQPGAASMANGQVALSTTAATLVAARATRRRVIIRNTHASINIYVGIATVTSSNGMLIPPGAELTLETTALVQGIAASGSPVASYIEEYD